MEELDLRRLEDGLLGAKKTVTLMVHLDDKRKELSRSISRIAGLVEIAAGGKVVVRPGDGLGVQAVPAISMGTEDFNIHYLAVPSGHQAAPFIEAVVSLAKDERPLQANMLQIQSLTEQLDISIFIASTCPHCPQAVRSALNLALSCPLVNLSIIDAQLYGDLADSFAVQSVPVTIFNKGLTLTGVRPSGELVKESVGLLSADGEARVISSMIQARRLDDVIKRLNSKRGIEGFVAAWGQSTTAIRIGLMLVAQSLLRTDKTVLDQIVPGLMSALASRDAALRGDTADLLGQIGHASAREAIEELLHDPNPDVAEIAKEALAEIASRGV